MDAIAKYAENMRIASYRLRMLRDAEADNARWPGHHTDNYLALLRDRYHEHLARCGLPAREPEYRELSAKEAQQEYIDRVLSIPL